MALQGLLGVVSKWGTQIGQVGSQWQEMLMEEEVGVCAGLLGGLVSGFSRERKKGASPLQKGVQAG